MKTVITNHYWSGKFTVSIHMDTPLGENNNIILYHEEISKKKYFNILRIVAWQKKHFLVEKVNDENNYEYHVTNKYQILR